MTGQPATPSRYHALDTLRAAMMFLGIYLHAVIPYPSVLEDTVTVIHVFRMPVFYVMAGFFAALLLDRYGARRAAKNRFWRIVVPFVVSWIIIFPLVALLDVTYASDFKRAVSFVLSGSFLRHPILLHLWFLYYLIVFYVASACIVVVLRYLLPDDFRDGLHRLFRRTMQSPWAPLPLAVLSFLALLPMKSASIDTPQSFIPIVHIVVAYAIPFAFGWLLWGKDDLLDTLSRRAWFYAALALLACAAYLGLALSHAAGGMAGPAGTATRAANALAMWCFIFSITGLFLRYLSGYSDLRRYLCDSSYFLYIAHGPLIVAFKLLLRDVPIPPLAKIMIILVATIAILLPVYRYAVRPTFIGAVLNGQKYPVKPTPAAAAAQ